MKKSTALLVSILFVSILSFSQSTSIGFFGGTNLSSINGAYYAHGFNSTNIDNSVGMQFGLVFDYALTESLSLYIDPSFIQKGFKYDNGDDLAGGPVFQGENKFQYVQLPLTLKLKLFKKKIFYIRSGLYMSFLLKARVKDEYSYTIYPGNPATEHIDEDIKNVMNQTTLGFVMSTGADIPLSSKLNLIIDASYMMDISDAMKNSQSYYPLPSGNNSKLYPTIGSVRNRGLALSVGLSFNL